MKPDPITVLRQLEWSGYDARDRQRFCPACGGDRDGTRHTPNCPVAACLALPQIEEPPVPASADRVRVERVAGPQTNIHWTQDTFAPSERTLFSLVREKDLQSFESALSATPEQRRVEELERENARFRGVLATIRDSGNAGAIPMDVRRAITDALMLPLSLRAAFPAPETKP